MNDTLMPEIINLCFRIDAKALTIYSDLSTDPHCKALQAFWRKMAQDEAQHVDYWKEAKKLAQTDSLPHFMGNLYVDRDHLIDILSKIDKMSLRYRTAPSLSNALMLAYRLEVFMLHEVFETIFSSLPKAGIHQSPAASYEDHIQGLVTMLLAHGTQSPEIELLGETLQQLWKKNRDLVRQMSQDELTGVLNRRGFFNAAKPILHLARRNGQAVGIMMLDIDDFKRINDTHGHLAGDEALKQMAHILEKGVRASDVLGRYGGEEFIILFSGIQADDIYQLGEKIRKMIVEETADHIPLTVSIGISAGKIGDEVEERMLELIKQADAGLYSAKDSGKNQVSCRLL